MTPSVGKNANKFEGYAKRDVHSEDTELTHVGPNTPGGEYLRRFWQPVALSSEVNHLPVAVTMLGEELVLFRTRKDELGLLHLHCSHRGASLEWGIPTDKGINCCYHGWQYATDGEILSAPNDPTSTIPEKTRHGAYPIHEYKGIVFTYMGPPDDVPDFPIYDSYELEDTEMVPFSLHMPCNWLQVLENTVDPTHSCFLHTLMSGIQFAESWQELPQIDFFESPLGMTSFNVRRWKENLWVRSGDTVLPNMNQGGSLWEKAENSKYYLRHALSRWMRPIDDTNTDIIGWRLFSDKVDPDHQGDKSQIGKGMIDFIGQTEDERSYHERQRVPGDFEAIVSQRPIAVHRMEHLTGADIGVAMLRRLVRRGIRAVKAGKPFKSPPKSSNRMIPTYTSDSVLHIPPRNGAERELMRELGRKVADTMLESDHLDPAGREKHFTKELEAFRQSKL
jgi:nitrite reductase/ring-hydroxylating ferredoxin subunit